VLVGGEVVIKFDDASYHARRAHYSFERFPAVLHFDPYLNHPDGSPSPWPPLWDLALAGAARATGRGPEALARVLAWAPAAVGALVVVPTFAAARALAGGGVALAAAALLAALPVHVAYSDVGNPDHHAWVSLLATTWLALLLHAARRPGWPAGAAALAAVRAALVLSWSGSLLYLGVAEGTLLLTGVAFARRDLLAGQALGALAAAAAAAPAVLAGGRPLGGPFSGVALSWTHVGALAALAVAAGCGAGWLARRPRASLPARIAAVAAPGALLAALALAAPQVREGLLPGMTIVGAADPWAPTNFEQQPLYAARRDAASAPPASGLYGHFAWILPLVLLAPWARLWSAAPRAPVLAFACWSSAFGVLAVTQIRYGNEFAPSAAICIALVVAAAWRELGRLGPGRAAPARAALVALALALTWPGLRALPLPRLERDLARLRGPAPAGDPLLATPAGTLQRFAELVREATPETSGFLDPTRRPEYGILAPATFGHALRWPGRRATPVDPFGPYLDARRFAAVEAFWRETDESEAAAALERLDARYLVTTGAMASPGPRIAQRLHARNGAAFAGHPHLGRFRLVLAGPLGGRGFPGWPAAHGEPPYKLFERVAGAVIEVAAPPGGAVLAELGLRTDAGFRFDFTAREVADAGGRARLRVPYASEPMAGVAPDGPWRLRVGDRELRADVSDGDVRAGAHVAAEPAAGGSGRR
jgi:dolichyl-diphosphooligosaccharide--protein glycosyltransferase